MYPALNIEGLHKEEHGVLCAACHYYPHVGWCKLIGWIALFFCPLIKGKPFRNGSCVAFVQTAFTETSSVRPETH